MATNWGKNQRNWSRNRNATSIQSSKTRRREQDFWVWTCITCFVSTMGQHKSAWIWSPEFSEPINIKYVMIRSDAGSEIGQETWELPKCCSFYELWMVVEDRICGIIVRFWVHYIVGFFLNPLMYNSSHIIKYSSIRLPQIFHENPNLLPICWLFDLFRVFRWALWFYVFILKCAFWFLVLLDFCWIHWCTTHQILSNIHQLGLPQIFHENQNFSVIC